MELHFSLKVEELIFHKNFGHIVEEPETDSKNKQSVAALTHLQDYINEIKHVRIKCTDIEYEHMYHKFSGYFSTYTGKQENNKTRVKFLRGKRTYPEKAVIFRKLERTSASKNNVSQFNPSGMVPDYNVHNGTIKRHKMDKKTTHFAVHIYPSIFGLKINELDH